MKIERWRKDRRGARIAVAVAGGMMGLVLGHLVTLGLVVARAHLFGVYVSTLDGVVGGLAFLTTPIGLLLGVWVVLTDRISAGRVLGVTAGGAVIGCGRFVEARLESHRRCG